MDTSQMDQRAVEQMGATWATVALEPLLKPGRGWFSTKNTPAESTLLWERTFGDFAGVLTDGKLWTLEVKAERRHTGNLYLETWSNRTTDAEWVRDGWMFTLRANLIAFVFLDAEVLYLTRLPDLKEWALSEGQMYRYPERTPHLDQRNNTVGHIVPVADLKRDIKLSTYRRNAVTGKWHRETNQTEASK